MIEEDANNDAAEANDWITMLIAPGGSLGGARPKASVATPDGRLMIAKFPSARDTHDVGGWEMVVHALARACGIKVSDSHAQKYASDQYTFLTTRFDRTPSGKRIHFASAMTMTNHVDGEDEGSGVSYLEIAQFLIQHGAESGADLRELWTRILFNVLVSNTDDHLRNHGFLLEPGKGWRLSAAYDMNPEPHAHGLKLNIDEHDNALDLDLVRSVAPYFRVSKNDAAGIERHCKDIVSRWRSIAERLGLPRSETGIMESAFRLASSQP
jgi:serine/threonine-protein kinase HipA